MLSKIFTILSLLMPLALIIRTKSQLNSINIRFILLQDMSKNLKHSNLTFDCCKCFFNNLIFNVSLMSI